MIKKILILLGFFIFSSNFAFAKSITEELTHLNNLYKEGAITEEEFSKAKSIILKTNSSNEQSKTKKAKNKEKNKNLDQKKNSSNEKSKTKKAKNKEKNKT